MFDDDSVPVPVGTRIEIEEVMLAVCPSGLVAKRMPTGRKVWVEMMPCGHWCYDDDYFCGRCGTKLREALGQ